MRNFFDFIGIRTDWSNLPSWLGGLLGFLFVAVGIIFSFSFLVVLIIFLMTLFWPLSEGLKDQAESIRNVGLVVAAFIGFPFLIWRTWVASNQATTSSEALFNNKITDAAKDLAARKQVSHLSSHDGINSSFDEWQDDIVVRTMAIHRLEGLSNERPEFSPRISRMLASYIRGNFPATNLDPTPDLQTRRSPRMDLQDAIDALGRVLKFSVNYEKENWRLNLTNTNFDGVNFAKGFFRATNFTGSRFEAAIFNEGNFHGAWFYGALLNYASFIKADFTGANLTEAIYNMPTTNPGGLSSRIARADIRGIDFSGADISGCTYLGGPKKIMETFGNKDTQVNRRLHPSKPSDDELNKAYLYRDGSGRTEYTEEEKTIFKKVDDSGFQNWSPYGSNDIASYGIKEDLMKKLNLNKWPYLGA